MHKVHSAEEKRDRPNVNSVQQNEFLFSIGNFKDNYWILDSGATRHVCNDKRFLTRWMKHTAVQFKWQVVIL